METKELSKCEQVFSEELTLIPNRDVRSFVIECFLKFAPDYFWTCPASTSRKYHPEISLGDGGLIRHTKLAVWWGSELAKSFELNPDQLGEVIAALILHDLVKNGQGLNAKGFSVDQEATSLHGVWLCNKILVMQADSFTSPEYRTRIAYMIGGHMGCWTNARHEAMKPSSLQDQEVRKLAWVVHLADYCASRKADEKMQQPSL